MWKAFRTLLINPGHERDSMSHRNDRGLTWTPTYTYETRNEPSRTQITHLRRDRALATHSSKTKRWTIPTTLVSITTRIVSYSDPILPQRNECGVLTDSPPIPTSWGSPINSITNNKLRPRVSQNTDIMARWEHQRVYVTCRTRTDRRQFLVRYK